MFMFTVLAEETFQSPDCFFFILFARKNYLANGNISLVILTLWHMCRVLA